MILKDGSEAFPAPPEVVRAWVEYLARFKAWEGRFFARWDHPEAGRVVPAWRYARPWLIPLREAERTIVEAVVYWGRFYSLSLESHAVPHVMGEEIKVYPDHTRFRDVFWDDRKGFGARYPTRRRARMFGEIYNEEVLDGSPRIVELMLVYREVYANLERMRSEANRRSGVVYAQQFVIPHWENLESPGRE